MSQLQHMSVAYKMIGKASVDPDTGVDSLYILRADWLDERYKSSMPDSFFKQLTPEEEELYRQWASDNYQPTLPEGFSAFHPVIRDEWKKLDVYKSEPMSFKLACQKAEIMALGGAGSYDPRASEYKTILIERVRDHVVVWDSSPNRYVGWTHTSRLMNGVK